MLTKDRVRQLLRENDLPDDARIELIRGRMKITDRYEPQSDVLWLNVTANSHTILHEGAHVEHYGNMCLRGTAMELSLDRQIGLAFTSEVFVGMRLARVPGWADAEGQRTKAKRCVTFGEFAALRSSRQLFLGNSNGEVFVNVPGLAAIMVLLPLLGVEIQQRNVNYFVALEPRSGYAGVMVAIVERLKGLANRDQINNVTEIDCLGSFVLEAAAKLCVNLRSFS